MDENDRNGRPEQRPSPLKRWLPLVAGGLAGAVTVTLLNEGARRLVPHAPRLDVIGERALSQSLRAAGVEPPHGDDLYRWTLASDLVSNALYYGLVGVGDPANATRRGASLGLAAGLGAVFLPRPLGLGRQPGEQPPLTQLLTVTWYLAGGLAAAATYRALSRDVS
ncbi:hypothetical protein E5F05_12125 [Deinococcus metallilatus]|uniref:Uncharacterized protein n=1 Tax=Deinococcus metallilatus TaxID=1211322 RepID=A0AAJ5F3M9_9DEIO|nr:hypothetical protein [Deinococcus metallilatus]MBB5295217.1 hypothetical protein [Deinococcus metallilatus]QBY08620.1 hypothetical protein E5F05_12125 [Deinococcus metallilatus]RXJ10499.1 hypothetical protein ERJ73_10955 [Deinococcus metallilatus]TLK26470.1 hypothetical protein FCS05_10705 [Deinococcus metallilatus]GMA14991.1 hypothetical protein GCM10025871_13220 [Deinococcus metallilatus]